MIYALVLDSEELTCLKEIEPSKPVIAILELKLSGKEIVEVFNTCKLYMDLQDVTNLLTVSDWTHVKRVINQNVTCKAGDILNGLSSDVS